MLWTPRTGLRRFALADAPEFLRLGSDPAIICYTDASARVLEKLGFDDVGGRCLPEFRPVAMRYFQRYL